MDIKIVDIKIDDAFISQWEPRFDEKSIGAEYVGEYPTLINDVAAEVALRGTISEPIFRRIWAWKGATRVIRHVRFDRYETLYAAAFARAILAPPERKIYELLNRGNKLPGVGAPTGSTVLHFIHPQNMPIIDVRTVETLYAARRIRTKTRDLQHYEEFRKAMDLLRSELPKFTLRQIDKALFAFHKIVLDGRATGCKSK